MTTENTFLFSQKENLMSSSFSCFYDMRKKTELCDVAIRIGNRIILAHRVVLAAAIPYFRTMFTSNMAESKKDEITMEGLDPGALESLINFAYIGEVEITTENMQSLLEASARLDLTQVRDSCCAFVSKGLNPSNAIKFRTLADDYIILTLIEKCDSYIAQRFEEFSRTEEFQNLSFSFLNKLIRRDDLRIKNEETVFETILCWVKTDEKRHSLLPELLTGTRMTHLTPQFLANKASGERLITESSACTNLLNEVIRYHRLQKERPVSCSFILSERCYVEQSDMYLLRPDGKRGRTVLKYVSETGTWSDLPAYRTSDTTYFHALALGGQIYVIELKKFERFNSFTFEWSSLPAFPDLYRYWKYALPYGKRIYWLENSSLPSTMYYFDPEENKWHNTQQNVLFSEAEVVSSSEGIYILDGVFKENGFREMKSKIYDPEMNRVTEIIQNMPTSRIATGCAVLDGKIYVCGGKRRSDRCSNVMPPSKCTEVYSPSDKQWRSVANMNNARKHFSLLPYNQKLYAIGGFDHKKNVDQIECYDPIKNEWTDVGQLNRKLRESIQAVMTSVQ